MGDGTREERGRRAREKSFRCPYSGTILSTVQSFSIAQRVHTLYVTGDACVIRLVNNIQRTGELVNLQPPPGWWEAERESIDRSIDR